MAGDVLNEISQATRYSVSSFWFKYALIEHVCFRYLFYIIALQSGIPANQYFK